MAGDLTDALASVLGVVVPGGYCGDRAAQIDVAGRHDRVERGESLREAGTVGSRAARQGAVDAGGGPA